jgi:NAD(P)H dehydrogenase (quinone)
MATVKLAIVYYSTYGTNHRMSETAAAAAREAGAEVRLRRVRETAPPELVRAQPAWSEQVERAAHVEEATPDDLAWADAILFSTPTRCGGAASQVRAFIDTLGPIWREGKLVNKFVSAMTSAQNTHGGQETTLQTLYFSFMHWGSIIVTPGYTDPSVFASGGNPYGASVTAGADGIPAEKQAAIRHQTRRLIETAAQFHR